MKAATRARTKAIAVQLLLVGWVAVFFFALSAVAGPSPKLTVLPGFKVTPIYSVPPEQGSWICMASDAKGRLLISSEMKSLPSAGPMIPTLFRLTVTNHKVCRIEKIQKQIREPQGLLYAFDSLYVNGTGPEGLGIYRLRQHGDDDFNDPELLWYVSYSGEHGSHALVLGPDNKIYVTSGNYVDHAAVVDNKISAESPFQHFGADHLLALYADRDGASQTSPGGTIGRMDADGGNFEIFCAGTRNIYDIAFNPDGELFGFDNDHESDIGTPWYRPCGLYHLVSGADYGFREGTAKLPAYEEDILPPVKYVSIGAPTGIKFGTGARFPEKYRRALFMLDWSYGRIFAAHLHPKGSTYDADIETIVHGSPLNVTDLEVTPNGAMYFITGGCNTRSTLYQLEYTNAFSATAPTHPEDVRTIQARSTRHQLESFHGGQGWFVVDRAWPYLADPDRNIRYSARVAIESQPVRKWKNSALTETNSLAALTALLALARVGDKDVQSSLLKAAAHFPLSSLSLEQALLKVRVLEISFVRQGRPDPAMASQLIAELELNFPSRSASLTPELCQVLLYLGDTPAIAKTLQLAHGAATRESQIYYLYCLSSISTGWTPEQRKDYFNLLQASPRPPAEPAVVSLMKDAGLEYTDGANVDKYLKLFRETFLKTVPLEQRNVFETEIAKTEAGNAPDHRTFIRNWKMQDLTASLAMVNSTRNLQAGRAAFESSKCIVCHRFNGAGGTIGPDLSAIAKRATARDILESILEPSKVVADPYRGTTFFMKNGDVQTGKVIEASAVEINVLVDAEKGRTISIRPSDIESRRTSEVSPMPEGLVNHLTEPQILDLIAYLLFGPITKNGM